MEKQIILALRWAANGAIYLLMGLITFGPSPFDWTSASHGAANLAIWLGVCVFGGMIVPVHMHYERAVRHNRAVVAMRPARQGDRAPYILFLRPFEADDASVHDRALPSGTKVNPWLVALWRGLRAAARGAILVFVAPRLMLAGGSAETLVLRLTEKLETLRPVVGIGGYFNALPDDFLAVRGEWKAPFRALADGADLIVMIPHWSKGCAYELAHLRGSGLLEKTVFLQLPQFADPTSWQQLTAHSLAEHGLKLPPLFPGGCMFRSAAGGRNMIMLADRFNMSMLRTVISTELKRCATERRAATGA